MKAHVTDPVDAFARQRTKLEALQTRIDTYKKSIEYTKTLMDRMKDGHRAVAQLHNDAYAISISWEHT